MATEPKLESYLDLLDRSLGGISTSDRAEIVTEIKSHVLEAMSREPSHDLSDILSSLGEPEAVANKYLLERGLKPGKASKSPIVKWLTIGFLGTFALIVLSIGLIIWKFTPIISVSDKEDKVSILGGLIQVDGKAGMMKAGSTSLASADEGSKHTFKGAKTLKTAKGYEFELSFENGKVQVVPSVDASLRWDCKYTGEKNSVIIQERDKGMHLSAGQAEGVDCRIEVPSEVAVNLHGENGAIDFLKAGGPVSVKLENGKIGFEPREKTNYHYEMRIEIGQVDSKFAKGSSEGKDAIPVKIQVEHGMINQI